MTAKDLEERYAGNLHGVLSCFDRIIIVGTMPGAYYARGMTSFFVPAEHWLFLPKAPKR